MNSKPCMTFSSQVIVLLIKLCFCGSYVDMTNEYLTAYWKAYIHTSGISILHHTFGHISIQVESLFSIIRTGIYPYKWNLYSRSYVRSYIHTSGISILDHTYGHISIQVESLFSIIRSVIYP